MITAMHSNYFQLEIQLLLKQQDPACSHCSTNNLSPPGTFPRVTLWLVKNVHPPDTRRCWCFLIGWSSGGMIFLVIFHRVLLLPQVNAGYYHNVTCGIP